MDPIEKSLKVNPDFSPEKMSSSFAEFKQNYPEFETTRILDELRELEYARLDWQNQIYLDYTGGGLYASSNNREAIYTLTLYKTVVSVCFAGGFIGNVKNRIWIDQERHRNWFLGDIYSLAEI
ncbi:MAG TPA: hypothetical protein VGK06_16035 [Methanosarcina sp.]|jgi:hypothetical protein